MAIRRKRTWLRWNVSHFPDCGGQGGAQVLTRKNVAEGREGMGSGSDKKSSVSQSRGYDSRGMGMAMKEQRSSQGNIPRTKTELGCQGRGEGARSQSFL